MPRQCLFCESNADTKEHLWPNWILRRLDIKRPMRHSIGGRPAKIIRHPEIEIKCVCEKCNGGWMHDLENMCIPVIGCLMEDVTFSLDRIQQATVARWTVKTAMVQDAIFTRPRELFFSSSERLGVRYDRGIPDFTRIWLGRSSLRTLTSDGTDLVLDIHTGNEILETANGTVHTFCVGHLAIQIATIHVHEKYNGQAFDLTPHISAPWDRLLIPIWPITSDKVTWPPAITFSGGSGLKKLADRFRGGTKREVWA